jgi:hypothetical protein
MRSCSRETGARKKIGSHSRGQVNEREGKGRRELGAFHLGLLTIHRLGRCTQAQARSVNQEEGQEGERWAQGDENECCLRIRAPLENLCLCVFGGLALKKKKNDKCASMRPLSPLSHLFLREPDAAHVGNKGGHSCVQDEIA